MRCFTGCVANSTRGSQSRNSVTPQNSKKWIFAPCANEDTEYLSDASDEETPPKKAQREAALSSVSTTASSFDVTPMSTTASSFDVTPGKHAHSLFRLNDRPEPMYDPLDIDEDEDSTTGLQLNKESIAAPELDEPENTKEKAEEQDYITSPFEAFDNYYVTPGKHTQSLFHLNDRPKPMYDLLKEPEDTKEKAEEQDYITSPFEAFDNYYHEESNVAPELDEPEDSKEKAEEQDHITSPFEAFDNYVGIPKQVQATLARPEVPVLTKAVEVPAPQTEIPSAPPMAPKEILTSLFIPKELTVRKMEKPVSEGSTITSPPAKHITEPSPEDDTTNFNDIIASALPTPVSMPQVLKPSAVQGEIGTPGNKDDFSLGMCETGQPVVQRAGIGGQDLVEHNAKSETIGVISAVAFIRLRAAAKAAAANHKSFVTQDGIETIPCLNKVVTSKSGPTVIGEMIPVVGGVVSSGMLMYKLAKVEDCFDVAATLAANVGFCVAANNPIVPVCFVVGLLGGWGIRKSVLMTDTPSLS